MGNVALVSIAGFERKSVGLEDDTIHRGLRMNLTSAPESQWSLCAHSVESFIELWKLTLVVRDIALSSI